MKKLVGELNSVTKKVMTGSDAVLKARERHTSKGKLLARDRIKRLIDPK